MKEMRKLVENYKRNKERSDELHDRLIYLLDYNTKLIATYGHNTGSGKGTVSSKVERLVLRIRETEEKILEVEDKIYTVNIAERVLNKRELEVINLIKEYGNELTKIAKMIDKDKKYVFDTRNRAIKKMSEFVGR
jgi:hypothetical protein